MVDPDNLAAMGQLGGPGKGQAGAKPDLEHAILGFDLPAIPGSAGGAPGSRAGSP
jgi:hypothetical protein